MSVQTEIDRIITAVGAAYDAVEAKGGTAPQSKTIENLAEAVNNIPSGSDITLGLTGTAVGQVPAVKTIDEQGQPTQWETRAFPEGVFTVNFTRIDTGEGYSLTSDKTPEEVLDAISAKKQIVAFLDEEQLCNFNYNITSGMYFYNISPEGSVHGAKWEISDPMAEELTYTLSFLRGNDFIGAPTTLMKGQILFSDGPNRCEFKSNIAYSNLPEVTTSDNGKFMRVVSGAWAAAEGDASFDIAGASTGQSPIINAVDADGKPTAWGTAVLAKADGSNIPSNAQDTWRTRIAALPGIKVYGKADANGKIKAYADAACTQEATVTTVLGLSDYGNALLIYDHRTYQCVGFEEPASMQGSGNYFAAVFSRSEIATDSAGTAVLKVETAKLNILDYLSGAINAPITITAGELPLTTTTT